jgi:hypothetical protein
MILKLYFSNYAYLVDDLEESLYNRMGCESGRDGGVVGGIIWVPWRKSERSFGGCCDELIVFRYLIRRCCDYLVSYYK